MCKTKTSPHLGSYCVVIILSIIVSYEMLCKFDVVVKVVVMIMLCNICACACVIQ